MLIGVGQSTLWVLRAVASSTVNAADWITTILTPITFALVLLAETRFRRRFAAVSWWLHHSHSEEDDYGLPTMHVYTLTNLGSESATNFMIEATCGLQVSGSGMSIIKAGENYEMTIRSTDFDNDWMLLTWVNSDDRRFIRYQWYPLNPNGPLERMRLSQVENLRRHRWWTKTHAVGPGAGSFGTRARLGKKTKTTSQMDKARELLAVTRMNRVRKPGDPGYKSRD